VANLLAIAVGVLVGLASATALARGRPVSAEPSTEPVPAAALAALGHALGGPVLREYVVALGDTTSADLRCRTYGYRPGDRLLGVVVRALPRATELP